uniref:FGFR1 oncogene partner (FOP) N-terminal dimerisation domain-containing protein n=1 Tax=Oncorhynchus kisutch TaxID=8019 RepID=A0A8C7MT85_ONCKI
MSATDDDTEVRDLLIQNLENSGKCLDTKDGRLVASLIIDFLQVFHLDFTLAVFQPEINSTAVSRVSCELDITETDMNRNTPLLLELVKRGRHKEKASIFSEISPSDINALPQIADARKKFDVYDKVIFFFFCRCAHFGHPHKFSIAIDYLVEVFKSIDFQEFLGLYKRFFSQCRSVVSHSHSDTSLRFGSLTGKGPGHVTPRHSEVSGDNDNGHTASLKKGLDLEVEEDLDEDDSFFDDPLPKPQKTYDAAQCSFSFMPYLCHERYQSKGFPFSAHFLFTTSSHRSDISKSEVSIGEEIEEVSIEGPDNSDKFDEITQDLSVSQLSQSQGADYMEEVA